MNLDPRDPDGSRNRLLVKLLGGLVIAGVVLGLFVGILGTTMLRSMGLKEQPQSETTSAQTDQSDASEGDSEDSQSDAESDEPADDDEHSGAEASEESPDAKRDREKKRDKPSPELHAQPQTAQPGEEVTLRGRMPRTPPGSLQVERREGGSWEPFPVTATLDPDGTFSTYIVTSRSGTQPFRLTHEESGKSTPVVRVTIR